MEGNTSILISETLLFTNYPTNQPTDKHEISYTSNETIFLGHAVYNKSKETLSRVESGKHAGRRRSQGQPYA